MDARERQAALIANLKAPVLEAGEQRVDRAGGPRRGQHSWKPAPDGEVGLGIDQSVGKLPDYRRRDPQLIVPPPRTTAEFSLPRGQRRTLPDDLLREASRRLAIASLLGAVLWAVGTITAYLNEKWLHWNIPASQIVLLAIGPRVYVIAGASVLMSLALFLYARTGDRDPRFILDLGLGYLVLTALALGLIWNWEPMPAGTMPSPQVSWAGAIVLMFAAIVPSSPGRMLVAGLMAASMMPLSMLIAQDPASWKLSTALMHYPDFVLVGAAVVISHVVTRLGQQVTTAREMGSYRLGELLGRGGMGEVYKATHRMLKRPAAIKLILPEGLADRGGDAAKMAVTRFRREAEAAANLQSPHTVALYDFGVAENQTLYFVMELLDGMDLETLVREEGPLPAARVIYILRQVCESLEEAHLRGLVHRDIKPANIHVGRFALRHDFVKVLDFGLVKSVADATGAHSVETAAGLTPGTPAYMAPEMARNATVDARADLYALGGVAYYTLTGPQVFDATTHIQMIAKHLQDEPVPPSRLAELPVPPALDQLVLACLAKKPEDRPPSAAALAQSLAAIEGEPWGEEQAMRWWRVHRPVARGRASAEVHRDLTERAVPRIFGADGEVVASTDTTIR
jgi:serine/threonine-protein kinase